MTPGTAAATGSRRWRVMAAVLVMLAVVCLVIWSDRPGGPPAEAVGTTTPSPSPAARATPLPSTAEPAVRPVRLLIPDLDLDTRLIELGQRRDLTVEVPRDPDRAGWFHPGTVPGAIGSSVILGHVDSPQGPAVFADLAALEPGARVTVTLDDGSVVTFAVRSVRTYANEDFPARRVYGSHGRSELNLVTCGGVYDASRGGYQSNVVVNARRV